MNSLLVYASAVSVAVAVLFGLLHFFGRRPGPGEPGGAAEPDLRVLSRTRVGVGRTLVIVEVEGRRLLLGSTKAQWCALADLGAAKHRDPRDSEGGIDAELLRALDAARHRRGGHR